MKKIIAMVGVSALFAGGAVAQTISPGVDYGISGEVGVICGVATADAFTLFDVDFGDLATTAAGTEVTVDPQGSIAFVCNDPDGLTRTVSSANAGFMVRTGSTGGAGNQIAYSVAFTGGNGLALAKSQLTAPNAASAGGSAAIRSGSNHNPQFFVNGVQTGPGPQGSFSTSVFAGDYTDTVTIAVAAN